MDEELILQEGAPEVAPELVPDAEDDALPIEEVAETSSLTREEIEAVVAEALKKAGIIGREEQDAEDEPVRLESMAEQAGLVRRQQGETGTAGEEPTEVENEVRRLYEQVREVDGRYGVDVLSIIRADEYLAGEVNAGRMDIKDAYIHHMNTRSRRGAPVERQRAAMPLPTRAGITQAEYERIDEALKRGTRVRVD